MYSSHLKAEISRLKSRLGDSSSADPSGSEEALLNELESTGDALEKMQAQNGEDDSTWG